MSGWTQVHSVCIQFSRICLFTYPMLDISHDYCRLLLSWAGCDREKHIIVRTVFWPSYSTFKFSFAVTLVCKVCKQTFKWYKCNLIFQLWQKYHRVNLRRNWTLDPRHMSPYSKAISQKELATLLLTKGFGQCRRSCYRQTQVMCCHLVVGSTTHIFTKAVNSITCVLFLFLDLCLCQRV